MAKCHFGAQDTCRQEMLKFKGKRAENPPPGIFQKNR
jgi:hypothetical protein